MEHYHEVDEHTTCGADTIGKVLNRAIQEFHHPRNRAKRYFAVVQYTLHIEQPSYFPSLLKRPTDLGGEVAIDAMSI